MKIEKNKWVSIHYTLKDEDGKQLDTSVGKEPLSYLHGNGYLITGLEKALEGKEAGDKFSCTIKPEEGYGKYDPQFVAEVKISEFGPVEGLEAGMQIPVMTAQGQTVATVKEIKAETIVLDLNHPLADKNLNFEVEVVEVREPTEEDLNPTGCGGCCGEEGGCDCGSGCGGCH